VLFRSTHFVGELSGRVFLSQDQAFAELALDTGETPGAADPLEARGLI
jgi:SulP family sulfate permease